MAARLTPQACRAARAILNWTTADLAREAEVSSTTVNNAEKGKPIRPSSEAAIIAALAKHNVEITNGDGTGARLRYVESEPR